MKNVDKRFYIKEISSCSFKLLIATFAFIGIYYSISFSQSLLYFTIQSNIWTALYLLLEAVFNIVSLIKKEKVYFRFLNIIKLVVTVSITLTGVVFCSMLAPLMGASAFDFANVLTHIVVPLLTIVDFFLFFDYRYKIKRKESLYSIITPLYYLCFSLTGYFLNWDFGEGNNYPYFFLNYDSPAGVFGYSSVAPYFIGSFYWIIILLAFIIGVSYLYVYLTGKVKVKSLS